VGEVGILVMLNVDNEEYLNISTKLFWREQLLWGIR